MHSERISIKFFTQDPTDLDLETLIPIFQQWIRQHTVEGLLIDVADYKHVRQGPGIILIGHEGDYALDMGDGRPGLLYTRKRDLPAHLPDLIHIITRLAVQAARALETEPALGDLRFDYAEAKITFLDRLNTPNTPETFELLKEDLRVVFAELYGTEKLVLESVHEDSRECFAVRIQVDSLVDPDAPVRLLLKREPDAGQLEVR